MLEGAFAVGAIVSVLCIAVHAVATVLVIRAIRVAAQRLTPRRIRILTLVLVMGTAGSLLTLAHLVEVAIWAGFYDVVGAITPEDAYYLAFVNFTTLGYGDIVPVYQWRLLGPITAANGMLLFGWSTAVLFAVLSRALRILRLE